MIKIVKTLILVAIPWTAAGSGSNKGQNLGKFITTENVALKTTLRLLSEHNSNTTVESNNTTIDTGSDTLSDKDRCLLGYNNRVWDITSTPNRCLGLCGYTRNEEIETLLNSTEESGTTNNITKVGGKKKRNNNGPCGSEGEAGCCHSSGVQAPDESRACLCWKQDSSSLDSSSGVSRFPFRMMTDGVLILLGLSISLVVTFP
mmetsp:Transcript_42380/g.83259  ORF Transcript_42380/g.83259 Transcript_42380/m.83259 type:complete len:203 (+) Transcript_42380:139-747(+)